MAGQEDRSKRYARILVQARELVVPVRRSDGTVAGVLDVDSTRPGWFDEADAVGLTPLANLVHAHPGERVLERGSHS
jgi:putative methionine-R-sulfoxide reductase with GAF domain